MGFVDRRRFSLRTIVDRVIFLFFQKNISKQFQNAFIRRLEEELVFETLVLKRNSLMGQPSPFRLHSLPSFLREV